MNAPFSPEARIALLVSGVLDMLLGAALVLAAAGVLPVGWAAAIGLPRWLLGAAGLFFFVSGTAVAGFQLTRPRPPE